MKNYSTFYLMLTISFVVMFGVMFLNVASLGHIYLSLTRFYMALLMVAPMAVVMLVLMWKIFKNQKKNWTIIFIAIGVFFVSLFLLRTQTPVKDDQYMKAMISHHSSAILTSRQANITDPEVKQLAEDIIETQIREINQMKDILNRMGE